MLHLCGLLGGSTVELINKIWKLALLINKTWKLAFWTFALGAMAITYFRFSSTFFHHTTTVLRSPRSSEVPAIHSVSAERYDRSTRINTGGLKPRRSGWDVQYQKTKDASEFVRKAALVALKGDGRAAFYVAEAVAVCGGVARELVGTTVDEIMNKREAQLMPLFATESAALRETILMRERQNYKYCEKYARGNPFDELPATSNNYRSAKYWRDLAYKEGDVVAIANHTIEAAHSPAISMNPWSQASKDALNAAQEDISHAVADGDPAAIFELNWVFMPPELQSVPNQNSILMLAACELGYDCTPDNPRLAGIFDCTAYGICPPGYTINDFVKNYLAADPKNSYANVYAAANTLADAIRRGDQQTSQQFFELKR